ncbi:MAG: DUF4382 domain-containing protein [Flavobacteriaceae bacterium]
MAIKNFKFAALAVVLFSAISCSKDSDSTKPATLTVNLTDAPGDYQQVNIDVQDVLISSSDDTWESLSNVNVGVYNLLDFTNGVDTLLTSSTLEAKNISQIRLLLGSNNTVMIDSVLYDLDTPSAEQSGLKLNVNADLEAGIEYAIWLDFDAGKSIVETGNGSYKLKPVIRTYTQALTGSIQGSVCLLDSSVYISLSNDSGETFGTYADVTTGAYQINGLEPGTYTLTATAGDNYQTVQLEDIVIESGDSEIMDEICLESSTITTK